MQPSLRTCQGIALVTFLIAACSPQPVSKERVAVGNASAQVGSPGGPTPSSGATEATKAPPAQANSRSVTVEGLTLRFENGGHVNLSGKDRWGGDYNTTYENPKFLLDALPVLERTFLAKQVEAVRKQLEQPTAETAK
jgi:hypothetical protein